MLTLEEAQERCLAGVVALASERVALATAVGRVLSRAITAGFSLPSFDASAMDGYAIATRDLEGSPPWSLPVRAEAAAGAPVPELAPRCAVRIFTGAPLPAGADAVVAQENVRREGECVRLDVAPASGQHVRRAGEDLAAGAIALPSGARLTPGALALMAMLDVAEVTVARRPRVTIVCTGDELRAVGERGGPGTIPESNAVALAALALQAGAVPIVAPIVRDDPADADQAIAEALGTSDLVLTVGGVSVGDHDVVRPALERAGVALDFWKVAIKPGKPVAFGRKDAVCVLGLPGNPASALVTFAIFGMPLLRAMQGDARPHALRSCVRLGSPRKRVPDRVELVRASLRRDASALVADPHDNQASGAATSLATSDGLAVVPGGAAPAPAGTWVDFLAWRDL